MKTYIPILKLTLAISAIGFLHVGPVSTAYAVVVSQSRAHSTTSLPTNRPADGVTNNTMTNRTLGVYCKEAEAFLGETAGMAPFKVPSILSYANVTTKAPILNYSGTTPPP